MSDGTVKIETELSIEGVQEGLKQIEKIVKKLDLSGLDFSKITKSVEEVSKSVQEIGKKAKDSEKEMQTLNSELSKSDKNNGLKETEKDMEKLATGAKEAEKEVKNLNSNTKFENLSKQIENSTQKLEIQNIKLKALKTAFSEATDVKTKNKLQEQIINTEASIIKLESSIDKLNKKKLDMKLDNNGFKSASMSLNNDFKEAAEGVKKSVTNMAKESEKEVTSMAQRIKGSLSDLGGFAKTAFVGIGTAILAVGTAGIGLGTAIAKVGSDFESQMSRVKAISGATSEEFEKLKGQAIQLGADTSFSSKEAAEGMENLASAGFTTSEIMAAMPGLLDLAASSGESLASSSDIAASTLRGFGLEADQAVHVADVLAKNAGATNAAVADTGEAMKYIAPVAHSMGLSLEEVTAAIGELSNAGIKGSQSGTTLRSALTRLASPSDTAAAKMQELGFNAFDAQGKLKNLSTIMDEYNKSLEGKTDQQKQDYTATIFGMEAMSGMLVLAGQGGDALNQLSESYKNADGAAAEMAKTMKDNLKGALDQLQGSLESLGLQIYYSVDNPLKDVVNSVNDMVGELSDSFKSGGFDAMAEKLGDIFANVATSVSEQLPSIIDMSVKVINNFIGGIKNNTDKLYTAGVEIIKSLAKGIGSIVPQLLDLGKDLLLKIAQGISDNLPTLVPQAAELILTIVNGLLDNIDLIIDAGLKIILGLVDGIANAMPKIIEKIPEIIEKIIAELVKNDNKLIEAGVQINLAIAKGIIQSIPELVKVVPNLIAAMVQEFKKGDFSEVGKSIIKSFAAAPMQDGANFAAWAKKQINDIKTTFETAGLKETVKKVLANMIPSLNEVGVDIAAWLRPKMQEAEKALEEEAKKIKESLNQKLNEIGNGIKSTLTVTIPQAIDEGINYIKTLPSRLAESFGESVGVVMNAGNQAGEWLKTNIPQMIDDVANWFSNLPSRIGNYLNESYNNLVEWGANLGAEAETAASNAINSIGNWFSQLPSNIMNWLNNVISDVIGFGSSMTTEAGNAANNTYNAIVDKIAEIPGKMLEIGGHIVQGLKNGIASGWNNLTGWIGGLCSNFIVGVEKKFEIKSPSRVFKRIGGFIMEGWQIGLTNGSSGLINIAKGISESLISAFQKPVLNAKLADSMITQFKSVTGSFQSLANEIKKAKEDLESTKGLKLEDNQAYKAAKEELERINDLEAGNKKSISSEQKKEMKKVAEDAVEVAKKQAEQEIKAAKDAAEQEVKIAEDKQKRITKLAEATTTAIKNKLEEERKATQDSYSKRLKELENNFNEEAELIDKSTKRKTDAIDRQIKALEEATTETSREDEREASNQNINLLKTKMANTSSAADRAALALQIKNAEKELDKKEDSWSIEDEKAKLEEEKNILSQKAEAKKNNLKEEYEDKKKSLEDELAASNEYYDKLLQTDALNAQARYIMLTASSEQLVQLLNSYAPAWQDAGQTLADSLVNGLNSGKQSVQDAVNEMINTRGSGNSSFRYFDEASQTYKGYASGTSYNPVEGLYKVDEEDFETTNNGSVAYVSKGAAINNHMQSLKAINEIISDKIGVIYGKLQNALYTEQYKMANLVASGVGSVSNKNINTYHDAGLTLQIENLNLETGQDVEQFSDEMNTLRLKKKKY